MYGVQNFSFMATIFCCSITLSLFSHGLNNKPKIQESNSKQILLTLVKTLYFGGTGLWILIIYLQKVLLFLQIFYQNVRTCWNVSSKPLIYVKDIPNIPEHTREIEVIWNGSPVP